MTAGDDAVGPQSLTCCPFTVAVSSVHSMMMPLLLEAAAKDTSGTCRMAEGVTVVGSEPTMSHVGVALWYAGRLKTLLMPPPPAAGPGETLGGNGDSSQTSSDVLYPVA